MSKKEKPGQPVKKLPQIISLLLFLAGIVLVLLGNFGGYLRIGGGAPLSPRTVAPGAGASVRCSAFALEIFHDGAIPFLVYETEKEALILALELTPEQIDLIERECDSCLSLSGTLVQNTPEQCAAIEAEVMEWLVIPSLGDLEPTEEIRQTVREAVCDCTLAVSSVRSCRFSFWWIVAGAVLVLASVIMRLCMRFSAKRVLPVTAAVFLVITGTLTVLLYRRFQTMATLEAQGDGLYTMTCCWDYDTDGFLNADLDSVETSVRWVEEKLLFGLHPDILDVSGYGCTAFTAATPDGARLMGRNFDYGETDQLLLYTAPKDGYASIGMVDISFLNIGEGLDFAADSFIGRYLLLSAPYITMDGINEKGLGVGILQVDDAPPLNMDTGKPGLMISSAIRGILDKCATVEEAIALLEQYELHTMQGYSHHLFITDRSGRSVVVEVYGNELSIVEDDVCENFVLTQNEYYGLKEDTRRYDIIRAHLTEAGNIVDRQQAMRILRDARSTQKGMETEWSCVYDLDSFSVDICLDGAFDKTYHFKAPPHKERLAP